jgi:hypothetical protein
VAGLARGGEPDGPAAAEGPPRAAGLLAGECAGWQPRIITRARLSRSPYESTGRRGTERRRRFAVIHKRYRYPPYRLRNVRGLCCGAAPHLTHPFDDSGMFCKSRRNHEVGSVRDVSSFRISRATIITGLCSN